VKKILIVDDDKFILNSFSRILIKRGFEVETCETGKQALEKLQEGSFDLALIDIGLPDMEGTDLLEKAKKELEKTIKIVLTGRPSVETSDKASFEGADTYIVKPIKTEELLSVINFFLLEKNSETKKQ
jgi:DNA-binding response OmpR family regulator